jgi:hypothetical protein
VLRAEPAVHAGRQINTALGAAKEYGHSIPNADATGTVLIYSAGDILVEAAEGGGYQVSRVNSNGRSSRVLGFQNSEPAAIGMASRATSAYQRVFLRVAPGPDGYRVVDTV